MGTGVEGAKSDRALASSGIFPAGWKEILVKAIVGLFSVSSMSAQLSHCILERKRSYTSPKEPTSVLLSMHGKLEIEHPYSVLLSYSSHSN